MIAVHTSEAFFAKVKRRASGQPLAVCLGAGQGGLGVIRGLGRAGISVIALGISSIDFGLYSKYCVGLNIGQDHWQEKMLAILTRLAAEIPGQKVLFPDNDKFAEFIYQHSSVLSQSYVWPMPVNLQSYRTLADKTCLNESAAKASVPFPKTCIPKDGAELRAWCAQALFPVVIKPVDSPTFASHFKRKGFIASSSEEALRYYDLAQAEGFSVLVQELIPGGTESLITVYLYRARTGKTIVSFVGKKVRQYPVDLGTASLYAAEPHPEAVKLSRALLESNDYYGIADIEYKKDFRDGLYKVIEVNGRIPMFAGIESGTGIPLSVHMFNDLAGQEQAPPVGLAPAGPAEPPFDDATRWVYAVKDLVAVLTMVRRGEVSLAEALKSHFARPKTYAISAADDLRPGFAFLKYLFEDALAYAKKRKH